MKNKERIEILEQRVAVLINRVNILEMKMEAMWPTTGGSVPSNPAPLWAFNTTVPVGTPYITCGTVKH